jgi:benzoyl-CoA reductase/2-hydroxyglutaryl-CoA dehydratase subunit BcrC/BadD/HgdB
VRGKLNILDLHLHSENFYLNFFNQLFDWQLQNMNVVKQNVEAIDLIDKTNSIVIQVSSTATKTKIESALSKKLSSYSGYSFKFISISKDASELRDKTYNTPHDIIFDPKSDIYDITSILKVIIVLDIGNQRRIYNFIKQELSSEPDVSKIDTNLASIINILAQEDWDKEFESYQVKPFEIDRKIEFNNLKDSKALIDDYKIHYNRVDKIYAEFNKLGVNKSKSVLASIRNDYLKSKTTISDDDLFFKIIELVIEKIQNSANYRQIPYEELELCVNILVVDAFIRCKIFENPEGYIYATP